MCANIASNSVFSDLGVAVHIDTLHRHGPRIHCCVRSCRNCASGVHRHVSSYVEGVKFQLVVL
jgi:hypothetical protein